MTKTTTSTARLLGYVRVSTDEQAASGLGLAAQEASIRAAVEHTPGAELVDITADEGHSGKDMDRPALMAAMSRLAAGDADGLIVAKLDRASRSVGDFASLLEWLDAAGATFKALDLGIDTSTAAGRLVANVMVSVGQWERETIAQRTVDALAAKRAAGGPISGPSVADQPELADKIRAWKAMEWTMQAIADALNAEGVPTLRGGVEWRPSSVQAAIGYRRPKQRHKAASFPAIPRRRATL